MKIKEEASQKNKANETGRGGHRREICRTGHAADRANIETQTVLCYYYGLISTLQIEEEASQKNLVDETGRNGHRGK